MVPKIDADSAYLYDYAPDAHNEGQPLPSSRFRRIKFIAQDAYKWALAMLTGLNFKRSPETPIIRQMPTIQKWGERGAYLCGLNPGYPFITELYLPLISWKKDFNLPGTMIKVPISTPRISVSTIHLISEEILNKKVLEGHRMVKFAAGSVSLDQFFDLLKDVFPESTFVKNDLIVTCKPEFTKLFRGMIANALRKADLNKVIQHQLDKLLSRWEKHAKNNESFDLRLDSLLFSSGVIFGAFLKNHDSDGQESEQLCKAVSDMNRYFYSKAVSLQVNKTDYENACGVFNRITNRLIEKKEEMPIFNEGELTLSQMQALVLTLLFGGQESTAFALDHFFAELALEPEKQERLFEASDDSLLNRMIDDCLLKIPPTMGVGRLLSNDMDIAFKIDGKTTGKFVRKGERLSPIFVEVAQRLLHEKIDASHTLHQRASIFGSGTHVCPGRSLALKEMGMAVQGVIRKFIILTDETEFTYTVSSVNQANRFMIKLRSRMV